MANTVQRIGMSLRKERGKFKSWASPTEDTDATLRWLDTMLAVRDVRLQSVWVDPEFYIPAGRSTLPRMGAKLHWQK